MALAVDDRYTTRNPVDDPFADHDHRGMRTTRPGNARHHRRIHHPQPFDSLDSAILINDRHGVCIWSHLTGPRHVPGCAHGLAYPEIQRVVVSQNGIRGVDPVIHHIFIRLGCQQAHRHTQAFPHPSPVVGMLEITVVKGRLDAGVGRGQPDVACAVGQPERTRDTCHLLRWHVTVQILRPHTGDALLPCVDHRGGPQHHVVDGAGPFGGVVETKVHRIDTRSESDAILDLEGHLGAEVVHEVLAYAGELMHYG